MPTLKVLSKGQPARRIEARPPGCTLGDPGSGNPLPGVSGAEAGRLELLGPPWRLRVVEGATALVVGGRAVVETPLEPGQPVGWGEWELELELELEPLPTPVGEAPGAGVQTPVWREAGEPAAWRWLKAGLVVELGLAERASAKEVQESVRAGQFSAERAAARVLAVAPIADDDARLLARVSVLTRDLVMAPTLRGAGRAARAGRGCVRGFLAFSLVQLAGFVLFTLLVFALFLGLRWQGTSLDAHADRLLGWIPGLEGASAGTGAERAPDPGSNR